MGQGSLGRLAGGSRERVRSQSRGEEEGSADWQGGTAYSGRAVHLSKDKASQEELCKGPCHLLHTGVTGKDPRRPQSPSKAWPRPTQPWKLTRIVLL